MILAPHQNRILLICAFRYALGRMSYVVDEIATLIEKNKDWISEGDKELYIKEIDRAIESGRAGMDMDVERWKKVKETLSNAIPIQTKVHKRS